MLKIAATLVAAVLALGACTAGGRDGDESDGRGGDGTIHVFAAASLTEPFSELADRFEASHPDVEIVLNLGGSSSLREQILDGAPSDVFASASEPVMAELITAGAVTDRPTVFATNQMAIAVPIDNPGEVSGLGDLARDDLLIGLCSTEVPCGKLAREVLARAGITAAPDTEESDVRALLNKVAIGELDAGLVYESDVEAGPGLDGDDDVRVETMGVEIPERHQATTSYPIATLGRPDVAPEAEEFVSFVLSAEGRSVLDDHGFGRP